MELKLFIYYKEGYHDIYKNVNNVYIKKVNNIRHLEVETTEKELIPLRDIEMCFMVDLKTMKEIFRYE